MEEAVYLAAFSIYSGLFVAAVNRSKHFYLYFWIVFVIGAAGSIVIAIWNSAISNAILIVEPVITDTKVLDLVKKKLFSIRAEGLWFFIWIWTYAFATFTNIINWYITRKEVGE